MSGIYQRALTASTVLSCDARSCGARWESQPYSTTGPAGSRDAHLGPALVDGWRVFVGGRGQHTYCPEHGPSVPMRVIHEAGQR